MPFRLTNEQLKLFNHTRDEKQMASYVRLWRKERANPVMKRHYYNEALHYFIQLPASTKRRIEILEHGNKR